MPTVIEELNKQQMKDKVVPVRSGDTVRVHQKIKEGSKERVQVFQGLVIRTDNQKSHLSRITVRRVSSGIGVEKSFLLHSPLIVKIEVTKRSKVRRNYLSYMRQRVGKASRLSGIEFDRASVNDVEIVQPQIAEPAQKTSHKLVEDTSEAGQNTTVESDKAD